MNKTNILMQSARGTELIPIDDMLLEESQMFLVGEITPDSANDLIKKLMYIDKKDLGEVTIYINSPGGEVMSGLAGYDYIKIMKSPVRTVCMGDTAS
ncbi:MAG: ATP-dependent Clp protease proteolytic subunit, partial [Oscillospiraceae bacterium]|nr:ATP-dependent Clp protease proteolytic subunit [Oscillospiraceae bacterium]